MGGLDDFYALQKGESDYDKAQRTESAWSRLQRTPSEFDKLQKKSADRMQAKNADNAKESTREAGFDPRDFEKRLFSQFPQALAEALMA